MARKKKDAAHGTHRSAATSHKRSAIATDSGATDSGANDNETTKLSRGVKVTLSIIVILQLLAVTAEPFRFFTRSSRGTSPAADPVRGMLAPYVEFAYLNHGYFFFAPEPGPSHLMQCTLEMPEGEAVLRFPDREAQWPRLLYHRHFMLAENLHQLWVPPVDPELADDDSEMVFNWRRERQMYERVRGSMEAHLVHRYGASSANIDRVEHRLPSSDEVLVKKLPLNDDSLYVVLPDDPGTNPATNSPTVDDPSTNSLAPGVLRQPAGSGGLVETPAPDSLSSETPRSQGPAPPFSNRPAENVELEGDQR